jgi:AraC family transcriptional regulator
MAGLEARVATTDAGGGDFRLPRATLGVFLVDQPAHRLGLGSDRRDLRPLSARDGWILPAGAEGVCRYDAPHRFVLVEIEPRLLEETGAAAAGFAPHVGALAPLLVELALAAPSLTAQGTLYRETMARALAAQVAATVAPAPAPVAALDDPRLRRAAAYVTDRLADDISLEAMAAEAAMSPFHFARAFKAATGASPLQYVIRARIETAQVLLKTTALPVAEIAHRVGYEDVSRFGQHFRRQTGATPGAFRKG